MANIDKVELEKEIDMHLQQEIPLAFLLDKYKLTYPQMQLLLNRTRSYTKKTDSLYDNYPNSSYDNVVQSYISIPHEIREEYPFSKEEQIGLFKRMAELKESIPVVSDNMIRLLDEEINRCKQELQTINMDEIAKAEKVIQEICNRQVTGDDFEDIFQRNFLTPQDFRRLNEVYTNYLRLCESLKELTGKREETERDLKLAKKMNREIEQIREDLVVHNIKLVNFCTRYFFNSIPLLQDDLQGYGLEGLTIAINGFDYRLGFQFSTYAVPVIVHKIERHFKEMTGFDWRDFCRREMIRYYRNWYKQEVGDQFIELNAKVLAESGLVPLTEKVIMNNDALIDGVVPSSDIQEPFEDEAEYGKRKFPATFEEYDSLDSYNDAYEVGVDTMASELINIEDINGTISTVLKTIPPRNAQVLILRFGLVDGKARTLEEIAKIFNVTHERVRQIEAKGLRLLRHPSRVQKLRGLADYFDEAIDVSNLDQLPPIEGPKKFR